MKDCIIDKRLYGVETIENKSYENENEKGFEKNSSFFNTGEVRLLRFFWTEGKVTL